MKLDFFTEDRLRLDDFLRKELPKAIALKTAEFSVSSKKSAASNNNSSFGTNTFDSPNPNNSVSNSKIRRLIISGSVSVNGKTIQRPAFELRGRSFVSVNFESEKFFYEKENDDIDFELTEKNIVYEDEFLIVVDKPARFPTEETIVGGEKRNNLHDEIVRYLWKKNPKLPNPPYVGIIHRLDRDTSGLILFTKQRSVNKAVQELFGGNEKGGEAGHVAENVGEREEKSGDTQPFRKIRKIYTALCTQGFGGGKSFSSSFSSINNNFSVEMYMERITPKSQQGKWGSVPESRGGKYSRTDFTLLEKTVFQGEKAYLFQAELFTGRTHQIRVHLSSKGLPIIGDNLYGGRKDFRLCLHSTHLEFNHPVSGERLSFDSRPDFFDGNFSIKLN